MRLRAVIVAAALAGPWAALAESVVVGDNTHTVGWPGFDQQGHLGFVGCDGTTKPMDEGVSFQASDQRCPSRPQAYNLTGKLSPIAPEVSPVALKDVIETRHIPSLT